MTPSSLMGSGRATYPSLVPLEYLSSLNHASRPRLYVRSPILSMSIGGILLRVSASWMLTETRVVWSAIPGQGFSLGNDAIFELSFRESLAHNARLNLPSYHP